MRVVVPFDGREPKTRLREVLSPAERLDFARAMLRDVLAAVRAADRPPTPEVLSTTAVDVDAPVTVDERPLDPAINDLLDDVDPDGGEALAVVMADLPLLGSATVDRLFAPDADVVLVPGRGGGTNAFLARHPEFRVDYHGVSYRDHRRRARGVGASLAAVDSYRFSTDVDAPEDLGEVLLHADGRAADWLREHGFRVAVTDGRMGVERREGRE